MAGRNERTKTRVVIKGETSETRKFTRVELEEGLQFKCRRRYWESRWRYNKFFLQCVDEIEDLQPNGFASVQIHRYFTVGILPKYCSIPDPLTLKERERVERLLKEK